MAQSPLIPMLWCALGVEEFDFGVYFPSLEPHTNSPSQTTHYIPARFLPWIIDATRFSR